MVSAPHSITQEVRNEQIGAVDSICHVGLARGGGGFARLRPQIFAPTLYAAATGGLCVAQGVSAVGLAWHRSLAQTVATLVPMPGTAKGAELFDVVEFCPAVAGCGAFESFAGELLRRLKLASVEVSPDSTGLDPETCSSYFQSRRQQRPSRKPYVKLNLSVVVGSPVAASAVANWGPCGELLQRHEAHVGFDFARLPTSTTTPRSSRQSSGLLDSSVGWSSSPEAFQQSNLGSDRNHIRRVDSN